MAKLTKWAIFLRVFALTLITGSAGRSVAADADEIAAWQRTVQQNTVVAYYRYLSLYPSGEYIEMAVEALRRLGAIPNGTMVPRVQGDRSGPSRQITSPDGVY